MIALSLLNSVTAERLGIRSPSVSRSNAITMKRVRIGALLLDMTLVVLAVALTVQLTAPSQYSLLSAAGVGIVLLGSIGARGSYSRRHIGGDTGLLSVIQGAAIALGVVAGVGYLLAGTGYLVGVAPWREQTILLLAIGVPLLLIGRIGVSQALRAQRKAGVARAKVLLIAPSSQHMSLDDLVARDGRYELVGNINPDWINSKADPIAALREWHHLEELDAVMVGDLDALGEDSARRIAWALEEFGVPLIVDTKIPAFAQNRGRLVSIDDMTAIQIDHGHMSKPMLVGKRALDIVVSTFALLFIAPIIAVVAVAIRIESRGPAFFVQPRVGQYGTLFPFFKLRSMKVNAHLERSDVLGPTDEGIMERYLNDTRITRVGKFIRRWSIDELPQLANVWLGHMSLVGPRPVLEEELHDLPTDGVRVHLVKPGLTGLWQVSGRKEIHWEDRIDLDLHYIDTRSMMVDAKILARTGSAIMKGSGAY
jgi:exopolysaccharide biosynthesis polyprenyl glycosylphosphotransferase